ncbi:concanavalin A-like lectin protein kinase family protein [Actinidia rufa]|uniref:non-specific serine/threonine protein kinase n=1 Tax=Actinidia rufa TaxID=165716 RepID=A0A7J0EZS1_9ERIC|nr:concanavalin A-like lectin protein kinase family protein [Actinidia rufa]
MKTHQNPPLFLSLLPIFLTFQPTSATEFVFNGFEPSNISLYGIAQLESNILTLTNMTSFSIGRALYPSKIPTRDPNSSRVLPFSTSFVFSMAPEKNTLPGHGIVFLFVPYTGTQNANEGQHLGFLNRTNDGNASNHVFGVEFDVFDNEEFNDLNANHVAINLNSLTSTFSHDAGYYGVGGDESSFKELKLNNGKNYQVWIDYADFHMNVTMAIAGMERPSRPLLNVSLNLSQVFEDEMYVGFTAATGALVQNHRILAWSFSNSNFSLSEELVTTGLPSFEPSKGSIFSVKRVHSRRDGGGFHCFRRLLRCFRGGFGEEEEEEGEGERGDGRVGIGVYKGVLAGGAEVAVKRLSHENNEGVRAFLAEISSLGRLKHRNLVGLRARMHGHSQVASTTRVVGTVGYLAPEVVRSGRASSATDVFGFGTLILEVMCGRRPIEEGKANLVDWVWELKGRGELVQALDQRLKGKGGFNEEEVDRVLHLGLLCTYPDPQARPTTMRQVVEVLEGKNEANESEGDDMDVYLLEKMKSEGMWSKYPHSFGNRSHPTFDQIKDSVSSSILSLSESDAILVGR